MRKLRSSDREGRPVPTEFTGVISLNCDRDSLAGDRRQTTSMKST
jgi:hypothetical protein